MKVLILVAHPDDEVLGVGGTLARHIEEGDDVYVCVVTKPYTPYWTEEYIKKKKEEQEQVDEYLGINSRICLDLPTVKLNMISTGEFNQMIADVVNKIDPDVIYTHDKCDLHSDHKLIFQSALVATRPPKKIRLYTFETLSESEWGDKIFEPNTWVNIENTLVKKLGAMLIYQSELRDEPHPRSLEGIKNLAKYRGSNVCLNYAEAFRLVREIIE